MGAPSFGSFGPAGPGFGSIQNAPAGGGNPTAFPSAPVAPISSMLSVPVPQGVGGAPTAGGGLGNMVGQSLGNLAGQQVGQLPQAPPAGGFQAFRAPSPMPPAPSASPAPAASPAASALNYGDPIPGGHGSQISQYMTVGGGQYSGLNSNLAGHESGTSAPTYQIPNPAYQPAYDAYQKAQQNPQGAAQPTAQPSLFGLGGL